jgi:hypothetical protein
MASHDVEGTRRTALRQGLSRIIPAGHARRCVVQVTMPSMRMPRPALDACARAVAETVGRHARALGVPARPVVSIDVSDAHTDVGFTVSGHPVRLPTADLPPVLAARSLTDAWADPADPRWPVAVSVAAGLAIEYDPAVLIGGPRAQALVRRARDAGVPSHYDDDLVAAALRYVVGNGVSVADLAPVVAALRAHTRTVSTAGQLAEIAIDALNPPCVQVGVSRPTLRRITAGGLHRDAFVDMRRRLFVELGVTFPDIALRETADLPDGQCSLRLNHVVAQWRPLRPEGSVVDLADAVAERLRRHAAWFVSMTDVRETVAELESALPTLVDVVRDRHSWPQLSLLTRALIQERVPVRNAARLMILLLDAPPSGHGRDRVRFSEPVRGQSRDDDGQCPRELVSYARKQMAEEHARMRPNVTSMDAERLPGDLDDALKAARTDGGILVGAVEPSAALRLFRQAEHHASTGKPMVAATPHSRAVAACLLAAQFPDVPVLAAEEYPPSYQWFSGAD